MSFSFFSYFFILLMALGGNRNHTDFLDAISTDVYWQLKHVTPDAAQLQKDAATDPAPATIDALAKDLESPDFATRDRARQDLERLGPPILPLLKPLTTSTDAEVAAVAQDLTRKFTERGQERGIRRLMAIRTLGERKEAAALPLLNSLKTSPELFVPEYAARAIAQINGEKYTPADLTDKLAADARLLPADAAAVAQSTGIASQSLTVASLVEMAAASDPMANMPGGAPRRDPKQLIPQVSQQLLLLLERVGNIRVDALTVGFNYTEEIVKAAPDAATKPDGMAETKPADDAPPAGTTVEHGWVALIIRGQFNSAAALAAARELIGQGATFTPAEKPGDVAVIADKDGEAALLVPSNQQVILITAPSAKENQAARDVFIAALKKGKGTLEDNKDLMALMQTVDTKAPVWAVCKLSDVMSKEMMDGTFKTLTLTTQSQPDGSTDFTIKAQTADADKAKAAVESMGTDIKSSLDDARQEAKTRPIMAPVVTFMESMKFSSEGAAGTLTGKLPAGLLNALMGEFPLTELLLPQAQVQPVPVPVQPVPVEVPAQ